MQIAATNNRFFTSCSSVELLTALQTGSKQGEFYQQLAQLLIKGFHTKGALIGLGQRLTAIAQHAYTLRQMDNVEQASQILMNLPLADYRNIGLYYYALSIKRRGQATQAETLLERVADDAPVRYRGQALLSLGAFAIARGDLESALPFYTEALRVTSKKDFLITVQTLKMVAVVRGMEGDHRGAVADLERLLPAVRAVSVCYPQPLSDHLNSLAVELCEEERLKEAQNVSRIVLASPYASAYPEYRETWDDIQVRSYRTSRSVLLLNHRALNIDNVVRLPLPERDEDASPEKSYRSPFHQQASVTVLKAWKEGKIVKEPNGDEKKDKEMDDRDAFMEIMRLSSQQGMSSKRLWEILEAVRKVTSKPDEG